LKAFIDFETRSAVDLIATGVYKYAAHHTTDVLCMAYALDDDPVQLWSRGNPFPAELAEAIEKGYQIHAWNSQFERIIWAKCKPDWPEIDFDQWRCTAAKSRHANMPGALAQATALCLPHLAGKDKDGARVMRTMCKPGKWTKAELANHPNRHDPGLKWIEDPISMAILEAYCMQDVVVEREMDKWLPTWPESEIKVWQCNERINDRGVPFDMKLCVGGHLMLKQQLAELSNRIHKLTDGEITTGNQIQKIRDFCNSRGINETCFDARHIEDLLDSDIPDDVRDVLKLRQITAGAAAKKYKAALDLMETDHRGRGLFMYHGASQTGRFASMKVQLQNMKKGSDRTETFAKAVYSGHYDIMKMLYGDQIVTELGKNVRSMICAPEGHKLVRCDSSQIECRVLHWLAGNEKMLKLFRDGEDPYIDLASKVYNRQITKDDPERQIGKFAVLGLGFGMGAGRFVGQCYEQGGIEINEKFAHRVVNLFRTDNPKIPAFWSDLETTAMQCVGRRQTLRVGKLVLAMEGDYMVMILPSGRRLFYYQPKFTGEGRSLRFQYTGPRGIRSEWAGGLLCENAVQAVARDTLTVYMRRAMSVDLDIVAHVHDELMVQCRADEDWQTKEMLMEAFTTKAPWMAGLPTAHEAKIRRRYE
jgi:DNA polymerase